MSQQTDQPTCTPQDFHDRHWADAEVGIYAQAQPSVVSIGALKLRDVLAAMQGDDSAVWQASSRMRGRLKECPTIDALGAEYRRLAADPAEADIKKADRPSALFKRQWIPAMSAACFKPGFRAIPKDEGDRLKWWHDCRFSGIIGFDIDHVDDAPGLRERLRDYPFIAYAGLSVSHGGVHCGVRISRPPLDLDEWRRIWLYTADHLKRAGLEVNPDPSAKDPTRLRFLSHDPALWWRDLDAIRNTVNEAVAGHTGTVIIDGEVVMIPPVSEFAQWEEPAKPKRPAKTRTKKAAAKTSTGTAPPAGSPSDAISRPGPTSTPSPLPEPLQRALSAQDVDDYNSWLGVGMAFKGAALDGVLNDDLAFDLWDTWSRTSKTKYGETAEKWASFTAPEYGWRPMLARGIRAWKVPGDGPAVPPPPVAAGPGATPGDATAPDFTIPATTGPDTPKKRKVAERIKATEDSLQRTFPPRSLDRIGDLDNEQHAYPTDATLSAHLVVDRGINNIRFVDGNNEWMYFDPAKGWTEAPERVLIRTMANCLRENTYRRVKKGAGYEIYLDPKTGGSPGYAHTVMRLVSGERVIFTKVDQWDADPAWLGLPDGKLWDVNAGQVVDAAVKHLVREHLPAVPAVTIPDNNRWTQLVESLFPDPEHRQFVQRRLGGSLGGDGVWGLDSMIYLWGDGGSGKGTFVTGMMNAFGTYARAIPPENILKGGRDPHPEWMARLAGARFVLADEVGNGKLKEQAVNYLLGSVITANRMARDSITFRLNAPLFITSNTPPAVTAANSGLMRRLSVLHVTPIPPEQQDPQFREDVVAGKYDGVIIRWLLDGLAQFREHGAARPDSLSAIAREVVVTNSEIDEFLDDLAARGVEGFVTNAELNTQWQDWKRSRGEHAAGLGRLGNELVAHHGCKRRRSSDGSARGIVIPFRDVPRRPDPLADTPFDNSRRAA